MHVDWLALTDFRNYQEVELSFPPEGLTLLTGANGQGKTNLLEAIGYAASLRSFRGAQPAALVRGGCSSAVIRARGARAARELLIEAEINLEGRNRTQLNRQPVRRTADLADGFVTTAFSPDDLQLVKGGPASRRTFLDELLEDWDKRYGATRSDLDRVLRQRNALLRQSGGRSTPEVLSTLDVWDERMIVLGERLARGRDQLLEHLQPLADGAYRALSRDLGAVGAVEVGVRAEWREDPFEGLADALASARKADLARGVTTMGPHRDEVALQLHGLPARTHASQGEQRTLALALKLAGHQLLQATIGVPPILLLDDVFSELDEDRSQLLLENLPGGQAFVTTTERAPWMPSPGLALDVRHGVVR